RDDGGIGREDRMAVDLRGVLERDGDVAELRHPGADPDAVALAEPLAGDGGGGDRRRGEPRRAASPAAGIATAVLLQVGVVGMARTERLRDVAVVLAARVLVADQQRDRGAGGLPLVHAGENLDLVGLPSLRHVARGAGAA